VSWFRLLSVVRRPWRVGLIYFFNGQYCDFIAHPRGHDQALWCGAFHITTCTGLPMCFSYTRTPGRSLSSVRIIAASSSRLMLNLFMVLFLVVTAAPRFGQCVNSTWQGKILQQVASTLFVYFCLKV
jgi:hypothetical protein